jgi:hypothetical protein
MLARCYPKSFHWGIRKGSPTTNFDDKFDCCRRAEQIDATGWLNLGADGHWRIQGEMMH